MYTPSYNSDPDIIKLKEDYINSSSTPEDKLFRKYRVYPELFLKEVIGIKLTCQQLELCTATGDITFCKKVVNDCKEYDINNNLEGREDNSLFKLPRNIRVIANKKGISVMSSKGNGKSCISSLISLWFLLFFKDSKIPVIGPSENHLRTVFFNELSLWYNKLKEPFKSMISIEKEKIYNNCSNNPGYNWYIYPRVVSKNADEGMQKAALGGAHAHNLLIIIDESAAMGDTLGQAVVETLTNPINFVIQLFNPTRTNGFAYRSHFDNNERELWIPLHWSAEDSELISKEHIKSMENRYGGRNSSLFRISVLGLPPIVDEDSLIPFIWVNRQVDIKVPDSNTSIFGLDVARFGSDKTVLVKRRGNYVYEIKSYSGKDSVEIAHIVKGEIKDDNTLIYIDTIGIGSGVYDVLIRMYNKTFPVSFSNSPSNKERFINQRAEIYWKLRDLFEKGSISIPDNEDLKMQLSTIKYKLNINGKIQIESKDDIKKRIGESTDYADALAISYVYSESVSTKLDKPEDMYIRKKTTKRGWMAV